MTTKQCLRRRAPNGFERVNETINGWRVFMRGFIWVEKENRKRLYVYALCPSCSQIKYKRADHILRIKRCGVCYMTKNRARLLSAS